MNNDPFMTASDSPFALIKRAPFKYILNAGKDHKYFCETLRSASLKPVELGDAIVVPADDKPENEAFLVGLAKIYGQSSIAVVYTDGSMHINVI